MDNAFQLNYTDQVDSDLVKLAIGGDKKALQNLIQRHQLFIYNLALKMTRSVEDAEDLTQEVFIKAITALAKFEGKSKFRTWLYRITVNHFLNAKKSKAELQTIDFETYFNSIDKVPMEELTAIEQNELTDTIEEIRISCTAGMLLCLDREQRIIYILGEMFEIDHNLGAEIVGISAGNFRIRLMRARKDLYNWMNERCGLVNKENPCRCSKKTKGYIEAGVVDPNNLIFNIRHKEKIYELSGQKAVSIAETVEDLYKGIFQQHPLQEPVTSKKIVEEIFNNNLIKLILNL
ncbi:RNA polymerase subunit sigma-70 [Niastella koreensis]|uniref:RNA polymerase sigma factor n=2 Tax=Niastella koreensis TaxID=354356 RepID=G8TFU6_NIAKG|nr:RNA polymerase sigma factor [Niastella koreensis]AEW00545.1 RNA polymerase, sigma subunit, ECF family [Niastella koreensis GR20-10]OQP52402.1 RNA polymerase subunit sigma-70 [Niastella koreensis]